MSRSGRPGRSKLEEAAWVALLERYVRGETREALAAEHGVSVEAVSWQARNRGYRKRDRPDAVYRWVQPPPVTAAPTPGEACGFAFDPDDLAGSEARAMETARRAAAEGRALDFVRVTQAVRAVRRLGGGGGVAPSTRLRPAGFGGSPLPMKGEEKGAALVLRPAQRPPEGDWSTWLFLGGRGAGKTLAGASWIADMAERCGRLALIGPALHDVREVMIGGPSGVAGLPRWAAAGAWPVYEPSRRRLTFPNGAEAHVFSAEDPDSLRGPQFAAAWADEYCAWPRGRGGPEETLALLRMGLRLPLHGADGGTAGAGAPRLCVTTTPRPTAALRRLRAGAGCVETRAATAENAAWLAPGFLEGLDALYGGTRRAAQELEGRVVEADGVLFTAEMMMRARAGSSRPKGDSPLERVVVALDPTATAGGDACGIVAAGRRDGAVWVLADRTVAGVGPDGWARRAAQAVEEFGAACVVAEVNQGGDMVRAVLRAAGCSVRVREVRATRGKRVRAEPVAALYEQGRVRHAAGLEALEEELMAFGGEEEGSLDRADALVWAVTDLLIDTPRVREPPRIRVL